LTTVKHELQNIIQGNGGKGEESLIQTISHHLRRSEESSASAQEMEFSKEQETKNLTVFIERNNLWYKGDIKEEDKIGEGAEQKVFYNPEKETVIKLNDSIFFSSWKDYFDNLLLHNYFFPVSKYTLLGFYIINYTLYAVVEQAFIKATEHIDLENVKEFLKQNGFENTKNNDYYNKYLGIILEDLHDENVISSNETFLFIDTVFYLTSEFYNSP